MLATASALQGLLLETVYDSLNYGMLHYRNNTQNRPSRSLSSFYR